MAALTSTHPRWARLERPELRAVPAPVPARPRPVRPPAPVLHRRRLVAVGLLVVVAFVAGVVFTLALASTPAGGSLTDEAREAQQVRYVVQPGDTLWRAAARLAPGEDPRVVVDAVAGARGTSTIVPGEVLVWPLD